MPELRTLTLDLAYCTARDVKKLLRVCPEDVMIHHRPGFNSPDHTVFPPCSDLLRKRLASYTGCVQASGVAVLAKCSRLREVNLWFNECPGDPESSPAAQQDTAHRLGQAKVPVTTVELCGLSDSKLVAPFESTLKKLSIIDADVDASHLKPRRAPAEGLQLLDLRSCRLDANSCGLIAAARVPLVRLDGCRITFRGADRQELDLATAKDFLKPLVCVSVSDGDSTVIECTP